MKKLLIIVAILWAPISAMAVNWEIGGGVTQYSKPPNSQYWQQEFQNDWNLVGHSYYIGVTDTKSHKSEWFNGWSTGTRWRVGFIDLGIISNRAVATSDDANYSATGGGCYDMSRCEPDDMSIWQTWGRTKGIEASISPEWPAGPFVLSVKAGVLFHWPTVAVRIWRDDRDTTRTAYDYQTRLNIGPTIGIGVAYEKVTAHLSCYLINLQNTGPEDPKNDANPATIPQNSGNKLCDTINLSATYRF